MFFTNIIVIYNNWIYKNCKYFIILKNNYIKDYLE